jgi:hypothetical protein
MPRSARRPAPTPQTPLRVPRGFSRHRAYDQPWREHRLARLGIIAVVDVTILDQTEASAVSNPAEHLLLLSVSSTDDRPLSPLLAFHFGHGFRVRPGSSFRSVPQA